MSNDGRARENGYRAFISYSHRDDAAAKSLHKRLETYRLPKKLIGQAGERGPITERLTPIFRDLDELSAADDLTVEIKAALARSATLIVLCSPGAKASKWVNLEIETFRALHGNSRPVLAALIEGEPADVFPPALIADGQEPVAADFRKGRDGKSLALLKLVAGMVGAPLDALVQRDAQRQYRRVMAITGGALTAALAMALLLVVALRAQTEAERQRQAAEGLVEYMLTDLRDKLKGVGRLDVMTAVNERAMKYYGGQEALEGLPAESLERRARILHAMGEDDVARGDKPAATAKFAEAHRTTAALLTQDPSDTERVFAHAQSEYWVGNLAWEKLDLATAKLKFRAYLALANQLVAADPGNAKWVKELGYAQGNLCATALDQKPDVISALRFCSEALDTIKRIAQATPSDQSLQIDLVNQHGWLADAYVAAGKLDLALSTRHNQINILGIMLKKSQNNSDLNYRFALVNRSISEIYTRLGNQNKAILHKNISKNIIDKLILVDSKNINYQKTLKNIENIFNNKVN